MATSFCSCRLAILACLTLAHLAITPSTSIATHISNTSNLVFKLINRDSLQSQISITTFKHKKQEKMVSTSDNADDYVSNLVPRPKQGALLMNFSIGEPPVPQLTVMDTGSSRTWVKCRPCPSCSQQSTQIFDPTKSSTYSSFTCSDCNNCNGNGQCPYQQHYLGSPSSQGIYAREQLTFETSDESKISVPHVTFGCSLKTEVTADAYKDINGVFGLGSGGFAIVPQLGSKFSYCIGNLRDPGYMFNQLVIGEKANMEGDSTPMDMIDGLYYVNLQDISIGERKLDMDPSIFRRDGPNTGVAMDSGTLYTWLANNGFEALSVAVADTIGGVLTRNMKQPGTLCYNGIVSQDLLGFPSVTLHFAEDAELVLDADSMFIQTSRNVFCMAVLPGNHMGDDYESFSVIGLMAQQNNNIGYDLKGRRLYFQRIDCELLQE